LGAYPVKPVPEKENEDFPLLIAVEFVKLPTGDLVSAWVESQGGLVGVVATYFSLPSESDSKSAASNCRYDLVTTTGDVSSESGFRLRTFFDQKVTRSWTLSYVNPNPKNM